MTDEEPKRIVIDLRGLTPGQRATCEQLANRIAALFVSIIMNEAATGADAKELLMLTPHALGLATLAAHGGADAIKDTLT
jgi:hypothetical protein